MIDSFAVSPNVFGPTSQLPLFGTVCENTEFVYAILHYPWYWGSAITNWRRTASGLVLHRLYRAGPWEIRVREYDEELARRRRGEPSRPGESERDRIRRIIEETSEELSELRRRRRRQFMDEFQLHSNPETDLESQVSTQNWDRVCNLVRQLGNGVDNPWRNTPHMRVIAKIGGIVYDHSTRQSICSATEQDSIPILESILRLGGVEDWGPRELVTDARAR